jgi:beta-mannanase
LKEQGKFDIEAQKIAFQKTYDAILSILDDEIQNYITETSGDLSIYLTQKIEAVVNENK